MKRLISALLVGLLLAAGAQGVLAQEKGAGGKGGGGGSHAKKHHEKMGLSEEQSQKMKEAFKAEKTAMKPLHREFRDALTKLNDALEDEAGDKDLQAAMDRVEKAKKAIEAEHERFRASMDSIVPLRQRAKMLLHMGGGMHPMGGVPPEGGMRRGRSIWMGGTGGPPTGSGPMGGHGEGVAGGEGGGGAGPAPVEPDEEDSED